MGWVKWFKIGSPLQRKRLHVHGYYEVSGIDSIYIPFKHVAKKQYKGAEVRL